MSAFRTWWRAMPTVIALAFAGVAPAAPALTTIQDVLYKADGSRFNGTIIFTWNNFQSGDGDPIPTQGIKVNVVNGYLKVRLVPTTNASAGANYSVKYMSQGEYQFTETWAVPSTGTVLRVRDVRVSTGTVIGGTGSVGADTTVAISDVTGLSTALAALQWKGPAFSTGRVAVIDSNGLVDAATGNLSDCLHVDGTSGTCGTATVTSNVAFADGETPGPTPNGVNAAFTLGNVPSPTASLEFYRNGILMKQGNDYTLSGSTVTFVAGAIPQANDLLTASYRYASSASSPSIPQYADGETPSPAPDGVNATFLLVATPSPAASLSLYRNGILMKQTYDYVVNGNTITFYAASLPKSTDVLTVFYRY